MNELNFMHWWKAVTGSPATVALILTVFGLMFGIVKPADALKCIGVILGIVIAMVVLPKVLVNLWLAMSIWHRLVLEAIGLCILSLKSPRGESRKR